MPLETANSGRKFGGTVYIISGVRSAFGSFEGALKDVPPAKLDIKLSAKPFVVQPWAAEDIEHVVMGQIIPSEPKDGYLARIAAVNTGIPPPHLRLPSIVSADRPRKPSYLLHRILRLANMSSRSAGAGAEND